MRQTYELLFVVCVNFTQDLKQLHHVSSLNLQHRSVVSFALKHGREMLLSSPFLGQTKVIDMVFKST